MSVEWKRILQGAAYVAILLTLSTPEARIALGKNWGLALAPAMLGGLVAWVNLTRTN